MPGERRRRCNSPGARPECGRSQKIRAELPDPATNRIGQPETANTQEKDPMSQTPYIYEDRRRSFLSCCYSFQEVLPGLLAMFFIAIFSNNLAGVPNPFTLENLFRYLDAVIGPINGQPLFQILNSNFVWNPFLLGLIIGNTFGVHDSWKRGLSYIHKLMPLGIIMLAPHFVFGYATKAGWAMIIFAFVIMVLTAQFTIWIGRRMGVDDRHAGDIAGALATGDPHVTAILMPMLKAKGGQVINALACVLLFGLIASFLLPLVGQLVGMKDEAFGLLSILGIGNTGQMYNAAFGYSYEAGRWAHYLEPVRHVIMPAGFLYVFFVLFLRSRINPDDPEIHATRPHKAVPLFVIIFIVCWILAQFHVFKEPAHLAIFEMVKWDFSLAAAALGLSLPLREIAQWGLRGFAITCIAGTARIVVLVAAIMAAVHFNWLTF